MNIYIRLLPKKFPSSQDLVISGVPFHPTISTTVIF